MERYLESDYFDDVSNVFVLLFLGEPKSQDREISNLFLLEIEREDIIIIIQQLNSRVDS